LLTLNQLKSSDVNPATAPRKKGFFQKQKTKLKNVAAQNLFKKTIWKVVEQGRSIEKSLQMGIQF